MKIIEIDVVGIVSIYCKNTWYIFRANGVEVKITMIDNNLKSDRKLTDLEIEYLNENIK